MHNSDTKWDQRFLELAEHIAGWSKDPSTKVGCVIVNEHRIIVGVGYNGFPRGVHDHEYRLNNREEKYLMVQHAETNAVLNASSSVRNCIAYVTHRPCANCTGVLIQAGISRVVTRPTPSGLATRFAESFKASSRMMYEVDVEIDVIEREQEW